MERDVADMEKQGYQVLSIEYPESPDEYGADQWNRYFDGYYPSLSRDSNFRHGDGEYRR
jgi:hypothetical protein